MEQSEAKRILEALLFVADQPVTLKNLQSVFETQFSKEEVRQLLDSLQADLAARESALELRELGGGWQLGTQQQFAPWIRKLFKDRLTYRLSPSALETLSIIAYKQPITRGEIEEIRGVDVSGVVDTLLERKLIKIVGRKEALGRPLLFGTTADFLRSFGLKHLEDLPAIESLVPAANMPTDALESDAPLLDAQLSTEAGSLPEPDAAEPVMSEATPETVGESNA